MKNFIVYFSFLFALCTFINKGAGAQKIYTKNGSISFFSKSLLEDITAKNNEVMSVLNQQSGEMQFTVLIKSFRFKKRLMEEHFNENYMESNQFPKASFKGNITDISTIKFNADGTYPVLVNGDLTIHGVTNKVSTRGEIIIKNAVVTCQSNFNITLADYKIDIPVLARKSIAKTISIAVSCLYNQKM